MPNSHFAFNFTPLKLQALGKTSFKVSPVGFGAFKIGRNQKVKYPVGDGYPLIDDGALHELIRLTHELGINLIDLAPSYGIAEARIGSTLKKLKLRNEFVMATKVGEVFDGKQSHYDFSPAHIQKSIENSIRLLGGEGLELVFLHCSSDDLDIMQSSDALETLDKLKTKGHIGAIGISTMSVAGGQLAAEVADVLMVAFNINYQNELEVIEKAKKLGKGVFLKKVLLSGHVDKSNPQSHPSEPIENNPTVPDCLQAALEIAKPDSIIIGTDKTSHLIDNVGFISSLINSASAAANHKPTQ